LKLTDKEIEQFDRDGFLIIRDFADTTECSAILDIAKVHLKYEITPIETEYEYIGIDDIKYKETVRRLRQVYDRDILFRNWMQSTKIRPILKQLLKDTPVLTLAHHNSIMTKHPHSSTETRWHRDIRYWRYQNDNLISIWLALGEENSSNGVLHFIKGSHKMEFSSELFDEKEYFVPTESEKNLLVSKIVTPTLNRGDIVLFHSKTLHSADKNRSDNPKISFVYTVKGLKNAPLPNTRSSSFDEVILYDDKVKRVSTNL